MEKNNIGKDRIANRHSLLACWKNASRWMILAQVLYACICIPINIYVCEDLAGGVWLSLKMGALGGAVVVLTVIFNGLAVKFPALSASLMLGGYVSKLGMVLVGLLLIQKKGMPNLSLLALELAIGIMLIALVEAWATKRTNVLTIQ